MKARRALISSVIFGLGVIFLFIIFSPVITLAPGLIEQKVIQPLVLRQIDNSDYYRNILTSSIYARTTSTFLAGSGGSKIFAPTTIDGKTFELIYLRNADGTQGLLSEFVKDKNYVYFTHSHAIPEANPASFQALTLDAGKDENQYFYKGIPLYQFMQVEPNPTLELYGSDGHSMQIAKIGTQYYSFNGSGMKATVVQKITKKEAETYPFQYPH